MSYNVENNTYEGYIYKIWNEINDKLYIGQTTTTLEHRWSQHISCRKENENLAICSAIKKYGKQFFHIEEIIKIQDQAKESLINRLNELEKEYIKLYHSHVNENGYNITLGGENTSDRIKHPVVAFNKDGQLLYTANSISEMSQITGKTINAIIRCCNGQSVPRDNFIFRYKGDSFDKYRTSVNKPHPVQTFCFTKDGEYINCFDSIVEASSKLNIPYDHIQWAMSKKTIADGYYFSKTNNFDYIPFTGNKIGVDVYSPNGSFLGRYCSISDGMRSVGLDVIVNGESNIKKCMNGEQKLAFGYVWRYSGDSFDKYNVIPRLSYMKCINVYDTKDIYIGTYIGQTIAAEILNCKTNSINSCLKGRQKTHNGYCFYYANDPNQPDITKITNITSKELYNQQIAQKN